MEGWKKQLELEKNNHDDDKEVVGLEKARMLEFEKNRLEWERDFRLFLTTEDEVIRIIGALVSQAESASSSILSTPVFNEAVKELTKVKYAYVDSVAKNMEEDMALQLKEKDKLLLEKYKLLKEKDDLLEEKSHLIMLLVKRQLEFRDSKKKKSEEAISSAADTAKKRSFGDIITACNTSPERRTRSHVLYQDTQNEEIPNKTQDEEYEEVERQENATSSAEVGGKNATRYEEEENATSSA